MSTSNWLENLETREGGREEKKREREIDVILKMQILHIFYRCDFVHFINLLADVVEILNSR